VRSLVSIPAGLLKMSFKRFLWASTLGTAAWTAIIAGAGYKLGEKYTDIEKVLGPAANAILVILVVGYIYRVWTHRYMPVEETSKPDHTSV
jgi:membrane protein DedA with SNARE-associated domain